jgi:antitoxin (DNA-binding transcriptional repressor) of toxin-antitoxin stability system
VVSIVTVARESIHQAASPAVGGLERRAWWVGFRRAIYEVETHLAQLFDRLAQGEEIVLARAGRLVARLVALATRSEPRVAGFWQGLVWIAHDFETCPPSWGRPSGERGTKAVARHPRAAVVVC